MACATDRILQMGLPIWLAFFVVLAVAAAVLSPRGCSQLVPG